jgi:hypothetical protein
LDSREEEAGEEADDGDHHEEFHEGEAPTLGARHASAATAGRFMARRKWLHRSGPHLF